MRLLGSSLVAPPAQLRVSLLENIIWLHPASDATSEVRDASVRGFVKLYLPKPRPVSSVVIVLQVAVDLSLSGQQLESFILWDDPKELIPPERQGRTFVAGEHSFPFVFNITPSAAPAERCNYGRVSQRVQAVGKGLGRANSDISSCFRYLAFVANPKPDVGDLPDELDVKLSGFHEDALGVWEFNAFSPCFAVASKFECQLQLMGAVVPLRMHSVNCVLKQTFVLQSPKSPANPYVTKPLRVSIFRQCVPGELHQHTDTILNAPQNVPEGSAWSMSFSGRLPNSNKLRPSTHERTVTPLAVKETVLCLELVFSTKKAQRQMLSISSPVFLASCMCRRGALQLPAYSECDPNSSVVRQDWTAPLGLISERKNECFCGVESHAVEEVTAPMTEEMGRDNSFQDLRHLVVDKDENTPLSRSRSTGL